MADPIHREALDRFGELNQRAQSLSLKEPAAMALATADATGLPTVRVVLLRGFDERGFVFYTNSQSRKGAQLAANPRGALCWFWEALHEQVRVEGSVELVSAEENDAYWQSRPRESQIASAASDQSRPLASRQEYEQRVAALTAEVDGKPVPRPDHWFGYRVVPDRIEFWSGRDARMHERTLYERSDEGWKRSLLFP